MGVAYFNSTFVTLVAGVRRQITLILVASMALAFEVHYIEGCVYRHVLCAQEKLVRSLVAI